MNSEIIFNLSCFKDELSRKLNQIEDLNLKNNEEYQNYSFGIMNFKKSKAIIEECYNKLIAFDIKKVLTENEMIDISLRQLNIALKFLLSGKEKVKDRFIKVSEEYKSIDEERFEIHNVMISIEDLMSFYYKSNSKNELTVIRIENEIRKMLDIQNELIDKKSIELTFACDILELFIGVEEIIEETIERFNNEILIETIDL